MYILMLFVMSLMFIRRIKYSFPLSCLINLLKNSCLSIEHEAPLESVSNPCSYHVILHGPVPGTAEADVAEVPGAARLDPRVPGHVEGLDQRHPVPGRPERVEVEVIQELRHAALTEHLHSHTASAQIYQSLKMNYDS